MIIVQRVSRMFAAENRTITSADMSGSRYVSEDSLTIQRATAFMRHLGYDLDEWQIGQIIRTVPYPGMSKFKIPQHPPPQDIRTSALAARQRQGKGPPSAISWRGRARNIKFRSQS